MLLETPPRAWGRLNELLCALRVWGNTPTCVGKTDFGQTCAAAGEKHPHVRGEDCKTLLRKNRFLETPPRAWGRHDTLADTPDEERNTPTCVGKTRHSYFRETGLQKHPHVRGEDFGVGVRVGSAGETPPRAWGRRGFRPLWRPHGRNTPTCVGKTRWYSDNHIKREKHPHVRGEDPTGEEQRSPLLETPPRAWGRQIRRRNFRNSTGNTPTCVGKTFACGSTSDAGWKHPHVRGEDSARPLPVTRMPETPPRAWGRRFRRKGAHINNRNTPTCVGKTPESVEISRTRRKHPHVRGED